MVQYEARETPTEMDGHLPYQVLADGIVIGEFLDTSDASMFMEQKVKGTLP